MEYGIVKPENRAVDEDWSPGEPHDFRLFEYEEIWVELYPFLLSRGYKLRPRYDPDWIPSWIGNPDPDAAYHAEDGIPSRQFLMDAMRADGSKVMLKQVDIERDELDIGLFVSSKPRSDDPRNYCVPILDVILVPACETHAIIVMPMLYQHVRLPFCHSGEFLEMGIQLSKCLEFLHDHNIAHRDFCYHNVMIDPTGILPQGFHPWEPGSPPEGRRNKEERLKWKSRWSVRPNRYHVIDFGLSRRYTKREGVLDWGVVGQDRDVPEMSNTVPYDPFPMDVYQFGSMLLSIYKGYHPNKTIDALVLLAKRMTNTDPNLRPTAREVVVEFDRLSQKIGFLGLRERVWPSDFPYTFSKKMRVMLGQYPYPD